MKATIISLSLTFMFVTNLHSQGIPYGQEFQVNSYTLGTQSSPTISALKDGGFVVCWMSRMIEHNGIYGQLFDNDCNKRGDEFQVNKYSTLSWLEGPEVTALSNGGFVVCWSGPDDSEDGIFGQQFDASGMKAGDQFQANTNIQLDQSRAKVAGLSGGGFIVGWESSIEWNYYTNIYGQLYDEAGYRKSTEFMINTYALSNQIMPSIAALSDGGFIVVWVGCKDTHSNTGIIGQLFEASGAKKCDEFMVAPDSILGGNGYPEVAATAEGFVVSWTGQDGSDWGVFGQLYNVSGVKQESIFQVNTFTQGSQGFPATAGLKDDNFIICWESDQQDGSYTGIFGQLFDVTGTKIFKEFPINTYFLSAQAEPAIANLPDSGFIICWSSYGQDGGQWGTGIVAKKFLDRPIVHQLQEYALAVPKNDTIINTTKPTFKWYQPSKIRKCYANEITYDLFIDMNYNFPDAQIIKNIEDTTYTIDSLAAGKTYFWKVLAKNLAGDSLWSTQKDWGFFIKHGATSVETAEQNLPTGFELFQNYPNPFNSSTEIKYSLPNVKANYKVQLKIYDVLGRLVKMLVDQEQKAGSFAIRWDGTGLMGNCVASGVYFYCLEAREFKSIRKMLVIQ